VQPLLHLTLGRPKSCSRAVCRSVETELFDEHKEWRDDLRCLAWVCSVPGINVTEGEKRD
jgi:hypothetical protein